MLECGERSGQGQIRSNLQNEMVFLKRPPQRVVFSFIFVLFKQFYRIKTVDFTGIPTWITRVEGKHAVHVTSTTDALFTRQWFRMIRCTF